MKRALALGGLVAFSLGSTACTSHQIQFWMDRQAEVATTPETSDDEALAKMYDDLPDTPTTGCSQFFWTSIEAGWTVEDWPFLAHILPRESNCQPDAYNKSGASGLAQVLSSWAASCGITKQQLFDPLENLRCARYVYNRQGKNAWSTWNGGK